MYDLNTILQPGIIMRKGRADKQKKKHIQIEMHIESMQKINETIDKPISTYVRRNMQK